MGSKLVLTGVTGPKSGGVLVEHIAENIEQIKAMFPSGIRIICRETSNTEKVEKLLTKLLDNGIGNLEIKRGNFLDEAFMAEALQDTDTVIHVDFLLLPATALRPALSSVRRSSVVSVCAVSLDD